MTQADLGKAAGGSADIRARLTPSPDGYRFKVGGVDVECLHTPGHTPGSQCVLADGTHLFSGDTLFIGSCGRVDLPDSSPKQLFASCAKLRALPSSTLVFPGHNYGGPRSTIAQETRAGVLGMDERSWRGMHGY